MLAADEKQTALQTIQAVVTAIAQNHYAAIPTLLSRSDIYQLESPQTSYLHILVLLQRLLNQLEEFFHKTIRILLAHAMPFSQRVNQVLYVQFLIHNTGDFFKSRLLKLIL